MREYLDNHASLIPKPFIRTLFENVIRVEYGAEAQQSSALQLLFLLPSVADNSVELLGYSDEAYTVEGGNSRIVDALANALAGQVHTGKVLTSLEAEGNKGFELKFQDGSELKSDFVIIAVPFNALRRVNIKAPLPGKLRRFIQQVDLGMNEKLLAGYTERIWRQESGFSLEAWTDLGFSEAWDGTQRQTEIDSAVLTYYLGGSEVDTLYNQPGSVSATGAEFTQRLSKYLPTLDTHTAGFHTRTGWGRDVYSGGAYVNYQPGQLTRFGEFLWIESDDPAEQQDVNVDRLVFAGEHLSDEFYGFMNGAAQTGRLAAQLVVDLITSDKTQDSKFKSA